MHLWFQFRNPPWLRSAYILHASRTSLLADPVPLHRLGALNSLFMPRLDHKSSSKTEREDICGGEVRAKTIWQVSSSGNGSSGSHIKDRRIGQEERPTCQANTSLTQSQPSGPWCCWSFISPPSHDGQRSQVDLKRDDDCEAKQGNKQLTSNRSDYEISPAG